MRRLTGRTKDGRPVVSAEALANVDGWFGGEAVERLSRYEDAHEALATAQAANLRRLDDLRAQGKEKTVQFRECLAMKLNYAHLLSLLPQETAGGRIGDPANDG